MNKIDKYAIKLGVSVAAIIIGSIIAMHIIFAVVNASSGDNSTEDDNNDPEIPGLENYRTPYTIITPDRPYHTYEQESNVSIIINPNLTEMLTVG